jgi:hypothetical protein
LCAIAFADSVASTRIGRCVWRLASRGGASVVLPVIGKNVVGGRRGGGFLVVYRGSSCADNEDPGTELSSPSLAMSSICWGGRGGGGGDTVRGLGGRRIGGGGNGEVTEDFEAAGGVDESAPSILGEE